VDKALNNPYNTAAIEYRLCIPPSKVMEIVAQQTEKLSPVQSYIPLSTKQNAQFWNKFESDDIFKIYRKWRAKGYSNSFAPWLVGWVKPGKEGSSVKIFFEMDEKVSRLERSSSYLLIFFTIIIGWLFIQNMVSDTLSNENIIGMAFISVFWFFWYGIRSYGFKLGQQDKAALLKFVEDLFAPYYVHWLFE
jgi:hypothetical protein